MVFWTEGAYDMTDSLQAPHMGTIKATVAGAFFLTGLLLGGCSAMQGGGAGGSKLRTYAADLAGSAKVCTVPKIDPAGGATIEASVKMSNEGGWCGLPVHQDGPKPFGAGLLTTRATHGNVTVHSVGDDTRLDYTPDRGFTGSDSFVVKLIPGNAIVSVAVLVTAP